MGIVEFYGYGFLFSLIFYTLNHIRTGRHEKSTLFLITTLVFMSAFWIYFIPVTIKMIYKRAMEAK